MELVKYNTDGSIIVYHRGVDYVLSRLDGLRVACDDHAPFSDELPLDLPKHHQAAHTRRLVIVEGVDGAGKSTFVEGLEWFYSKKLGHTVEVLHRSRIPEGRTALQEYVTDVEAALERSHVVIMDRGHVSEVVYGNTFRGTHAITSEVWLALFRLYSRTDVKVTKAYLFAQRDELARRIISRGDDPHILPRIHDLLEAYEGALARDAAMTGGPWLRWDTSTIHDVPIPLATDLGLFAAPRR